MKNFCLFGILIIALSNVAFAQQLSRNNNLKVENSNLSSSKDSLSYKQSEINNLENQPWKNSAFIATTYGYPQGFRFDLGYNFGDIVSAGFNIGVLDYWENHSKMSIGLTLKFNVPIKNSRFTPYFLFSTGKFIDLYSDGPTENFFNLALGCMYSIQDWVQFRPEICYVITSSKSSGFVAPSITTKKNYFGLNIAFEFDLANIF
jgi:hypothetical protein